LHIHRGTADPSRNLQGRPRPTRFASRRWGKISRSVTNARYRSALTRSGHPTEQNPRGHHLPDSRPAALSEILLIEPRGFRLQVNRPARLKRADAQKMLRVVRRIAARIEIAAVIAPRTPAPHMACPGHARTAMQHLLHQHGTLAPEIPLLEENARLQTYPRLV